ncbi:MAG: DUF1513 domain-containing protein [Proteobacteria bacterium]|nr:DUF1513 domain-containing protein [Pseudomonadota bacterium]
MKKRTFLGGLTAGLAGALLPSFAFATPAAPATGSGPAVIAAWRSSLRLSPRGEVLDGTGGDYVGILEPDWHAGRVHIRLALPVPNRVHGLVALPDGGFVAVAYRPGQWLQRIDAGGGVAQRLEMASEGSSADARTLDGHAVLSPDGRWLVTTETQPASGEGWISVRDPQTLKKQAEWRTHGIEPHEARFDASGRLLVANGGILRAAGDRKRDLDRMASSLVRLDIDSGELLGQWRVRDPRLSLRHLAVATGNAPNGKPYVGIAMQAEHDEPARRAAAPIFAVWDGERLDIPSHMPIGQGYCSDIAPAPDGGFYLNGERANRVFRWHPDKPGELAVIAELERAGALASWRPGDLEGVFIGAARGMARWHPVEKPAMLRWPVEMALDNHWTLRAG